MAVASTVYSLRQSPPTHDFVNWLARVERMRREQNVDKFVVNIVPGQRMFSDRDKYYTPERRMWRIDNLLAPIARLCPSVADVVLAPEGEQLVSYANPGMPQPPIFSAPLLAQQIVAKAIPPRTVTITLRQSDFEPGRNTNQEEWEKVADWLAAEGFTPVFIPDAEADMRGLARPTGHAEYLAASYNFAVKLALWERATLNLMTNSGPMVMALHSDIPLMCFKLYVPGIAGCQKQHLIQSGFSPEHDWSTAAHKKQLFWEDDLAKNIIPKLKDRLGK